MRGPKAGNALQEVCVCTRSGEPWRLCLGSPLELICLFLFVGGVPGLCLDKNRPGCAWMRAAEGAWSQNE